MLKVLVKKQLMEIFRSYFYNAKKPSPEGRQPGFAEPKEGRHQVGPACRPAPVGGFALPSQERGFPRYCTSTTRMVSRV